LPIFSTTKRVDLGAKLKISGQTPAYDVAIEFNGGPSGITDFVNRTDEQMTGTQDRECATRAVVGNEFSFPYFARKISEQEQHDMLTGSNAFFARGYITYRDVFNCWHWMKYCYQFTGNGTEPIECQGTLHPNEVDDENGCYPRPHQCTATPPVSP
jgi:hypothetical protein